MALLVGDLRAEVQQAVGQLKGEANAASLGRKRRRQAVAVWRFQCFGLSPRIGSLDVVGCSFGGRRRG